MFFKSLYNDYTVIGGNYHSTAPDSRCFLSEVSKVSLTQKCMLGSSFFRATVRRVPVGISRVPEGNEIFVLVELFHLTVYEPASSDDWSSQV